jgi:hypothetical protein
MEASSILPGVLRLHKDHGVVVRKFVIDDDATTKAYIRNSHQALINAGRMKAEDWPLTKTTKKGSR